MGGCVLARESAHGPPGAGEARRRHPFQWSREALTTFASSASPLLCFLCVKRGPPRRDFNAEKQRSATHGDVWSDVPLAGWSDE